MSKKEYTVSDLFFTEWKDLDDKTKSQVYALHLQMKTMPKDAPEYGFYLIETLYLLRKNIPLVDQLGLHGTPAMVVEIFNDLTFFDTPWYNFPSFPLEELHTPNEYLARASFDHFIYADNEFSLYVLNQDPQWIEAHKDAVRSGDSQYHLRRLVATLYQKDFDKEDVDTIANELSLEDWQLNLVFFTYSHVREFVMKRYPTLLPPRKKSEYDPATAIPTGPMWKSIKHRLAETPAFQGYDVAGNANMYATLDYLEDLAQRYANAKTN